MSGCASWPPRRLPFRLIVAIPGSVLSVEHGLLSKTFRAGVIARLLSIYRVDEVVVYRDEDTLRGDDRLLALLLAYAETPPHLRKKAFPLMGELRYAGILPPLRTVSHEPPEKATEGAVVEGLVTRRKGSECIVFLGKMGEVRVPHCGLDAGSRVVVRIVDAKKRIAEPTSWDGVYSGYRVARASSLSEALLYGRRRGFAVVATSRLGACPKRAVVCEIISEARRRGGVLIAFGGPRRGLLGHLSPGQYDYTLNVVPEQGVKTVRTDEALGAALSTLDTAYAGGWC